MLVAETGADVAELADALDSKSSVFTDVWVRPPPSAPCQSRGCAEVIDSVVTR